MGKSAKGATSPQTIESVLESSPGNRKGVTAKDSIIRATMPTASGTQYTVFHTGQSNQGAVGGPLSVSDDYRGVKRKAARLSISAAPTEKFADLKNLIESLPPDWKMLDRKPRIRASATSSRVQEEERNVHVTAFLYAANREDNNDFQLIIGRDQKADLEMYMTMVLSGLPPASSPSFAQLKAAREAFEQFLNEHAGGQMPGETYDFYHPPIPVQVDGSLFFNIATHEMFIDNTLGSRTGPPSLKSYMPVNWEVHPITKIVFNS